MALVRVYRARLRARLVVVQELFAILGIAVGVALLFSSLVASTSLNSSVRELSAQLVGRTQFQIDARGPAGFGERLVGEIQRLPGVRSALPILEQPVTLIGPSGQEPVDLLGVSPRFVADAGGPLLRRFNANQLAHQQALALPAPLATAVGAGPLQTVQLQVGDRLVPTLVGTALQEADIGGLVHDPVVLAPIAYAQTLTGMSGRVTRVFVQVKPGDKERVRSALQALAQREHLNLQPADFDAELFSVASNPQNQGEELFSAISAMVGFLFAFTAVLLTISQRREFVEVLRLRGNTRAMTIQTLVFEGVVMGVVACVVGLAFGELLSVAVFKPTPGYLSFAFPVGSQRVITWPTIAVSVAAGMAAALTGVLAPMRDILGRSLRSEVELERGPRGWTWFQMGAGLVCLVATTAILVLRPQSAVLGNFTLIVALGCLLPFLFNGCLVIFDKLQGLMTVASPRLAIIHLRDPLTRVPSLAVAATAAVAVFGSVAVQGAQQNLQAGLNKTATEMNFVTGLWVSVGGVANTLGTTPFSATVASRLTRLPGVARVSVYRGGFLDIGDRRAWVIAPPRDSTRLIPPGQLLQGSLPLATRRVREGGWAVLSEAVAEEQHLHIGQSFTLPAPNPTTLRVAALSTNAGWPPGAVILNAEDYARAWGSTDASALNISLAPGTTPERGRREVMQALGPNTGLAVQTAAERAGRWQTISKQGLSRLSQIAILVILAAVFAIGGVLGSMLWQRRPDLAYLKRQSYTRGTLWRALFWETVLLLGSGCLIGGVFGLYGQLLISAALATVTGFPIVINIGVFIAVSSFAVVCAAALAVLAVPGYLAVRVRPTSVSPA
jgi:putative ABC transport system permease protein